MIRRLSYVLLVVGLAGCGTSSGPTPVSLIATFEDIAPADALVSSDGAEHPVEFGPGVWALHGADPDVLFIPDTPAPTALERLAEDGDPTMLAATVATLPVVESSGIFAKLDGTTYAQAPIMPGDKVAVILQVTPGEHLSMATMFGQSNDTFVALVDVDPLPGGVPAGDVTASFAYFDAGTEVDEEPGVGADQAPRQPAPNTGAAQNGAVTELVDDTDAAGWKFPSLSSVLRVTIAALPGQ